MLTPHRSVLMTIHRPGQATSHASSSPIAAHHPTPPLAPVKNRPPGDAMIRRQRLPHGRPLPSHVTPPSTATATTPSIPRTDAQALRPETAQPAKRRRHGAVATGTTGTTTTATTIATAPPVPSPRHPARMPRHSGRRERPTKKTSTATAATTSATTNTAANPVAPSPASAAHPVEPVDAHGHVSGGSRSRESPHSDPDTVEETSALRGLRLREAFSLRAQRRRPSRHSPGPQREHRLLLLLMSQRR